ncbi:MAG: hypothetical protein PHH04_02115 [Thomasclavelia sp.]|nr:hypothetical protein [Thomasclavelia sp.]
MNNKEIIIKYCKEQLNLNDNRCKQEYSSIHTCKDVEEEFVKYIQEGWSDNPIHEQGYNAKTLNEKFPLSVLGAFNYLIYLRDNPKEALDNLNKGLPRR